MPILKWTMSGENLFLPYANSKGTDPRSLISAFVVRCLDSVFLVPKSEIPSLYLASVAAQAGLSHTWLKTPKASFLLTRLN